MYKRQAVVNDKNLVEAAADSMTTVLGEGKIDFFEEPQMGGETFSFFTEQVPSCFFFLGIGDPDTLPEGAGLHHNGNFRWHDHVLKTYMQGLSQIALDYLTRQK